MGGGANRAQLRVLAGQGFRVHGRRAGRSRSGRPARIVRGGAAVRPAKRRAIPDVRIVVVATAHADVRRAPRPRGAPAVFEEQQGPARSRRRVARRAGQRGQRVPVGRRARRSRHPVGTRESGRRGGRRARGARGKNSPAAMARHHRAALRLGRRPGDDAGGHRRDTRPFARTRATDRSESDGAAALADRGGLGARSSRRALSA